MSPKYSTSDSDDATQWRSDTRHVFAEWQSKPFMGVKHRRETVEQRLVAEYSHDVGVDFLHEARSEDSKKFSSEWEVVQRLEVREYGARLDRQPNVRYLE